MPDPSPPGSLPVPVPQQAQPAVPYLDLRSTRPADYSSYPPPPSEKANESAHGGLMEYWRIIRRRKGTIALFGFLVALAACLYTLPQTPIYQARTVLELQSMNENFLNLRDVNPTNESTMYYPEYDLQTQVRILQSRTLLERVNSKLKDRPKPAAPPSSRIDAWRRALQLPESKTESAPFASVRVRSQANTRLIDITCDSNNPRYAAEYVNTLASEYIEQNLESRWKSTQNTGAWLARQMEDIRIKLEKSEEELQSYARLTGLLFTSEKNNLSEERLRQLQEELSKAQADRVSKQSRYELAAAASPDSLPDVVDDLTLREQYSKILDVRRQLAEAASSLTPAHPKVKRLQAQITEMEAALSQQKGTIVARIRNDFQSAERREKLLAADYGAQARLMAEQADKVTHYNILKREVDTNRQLYDNMLQRVKEAGVASALRASNVRIVEPALPPAGPYKPDVFQNTTTGLFIGLVLGLAFVVVRERADRTLQEPGDSAFYLGAPELGVIPSLQADLRMQKQLRLTGGASSEELGLITYTRKPSVLAESFRAILTSIMFGGQSGRPKVIVLSSPAPAEGKSTVAANLAIALSEINQRVLLIDADMRKPRLHQIFETDNTGGLAAVLRSRDGAPAPNGFIKQTQVPNLHLLPTGVDSESAPALLYSQRTAELLQTLRPQFDMIVIDTPPMLQLPDSRILGRLSDGVILVFRAGQTTRDAALAARQRFSEDGTPILGVILNDWNPKHSTLYGYSGYKYYGYHYRYYKHHDAKNGG